MVANLIDNLAKSLFVDAVVLGQQICILHDKVFHVDASRFVSRRLDVGDPTEVLLRLRHHVPPFRLARHLLHVLVWSFLLVNLCGLLLSTNFLIHFGSSHPLWLLYLGGRLLDN